MAEKCPPEHETVTMELWMFAQNESARRFYQKNGFTDDGSAEWVRVGEKDYQSVKYSVCVQRRTA